MRKIVPVGLRPLTLLGKTYRTLRDWYRTNIFYRLIWDMRYRLLRKKIKNKEKVTVAFVLVNADTWKLDELYCALDKHESFTPEVIVAPFVSKGSDFLLEQLDRCVRLCERRNYDYFVGYDLATGQSIDLQQDLVIDIVFFTNPNVLSSKEYCIDNFKSSLTCYVPYSFRIDNLYAYEYNSRLVNMTWMNFWETDYHKVLSQQYAANRGKNVIVTGYPQIDILLNSKSSRTSCDEHRKKIIWAPHWTIKGLQSSGLDWSCFLDFESDFLELADKWQEEIEIILKPHPFLFDLLEDTCWGKKMVSNYKEEWARRENCSIVYGDYTDLFLSSDAIIHDSGSFLIEYLALDRPAAYTLSTEEYSGRFNCIGNEAIAAHHIIREREDLNNFVDSVMSGSDCKAEDRILFEKKYLNYSSASAKIVDTLSSLI